MRLFIGILVALLILAHQDYWQWDRDQLVFGFLPYTMAYHAMISLAAALVWLLAVVFCWPQDAQPPVPTSGSPGFPAGSAKGKGAAS